MVYRGMEWNGPCYNDYHKSACGVSLNFLSDQFPCSSMYGTVMSAKSDDETQHASPS